MGELYFSGSCPKCGKAMSQALLCEVAEERAQAHLEGGDTFAGGEVYAPCPFCGEEITLATQGETEVVRRARVSRVVCLR